MVDGEIEWEIEAIIGKSVEQVMVEERREVHSQRGRKRWATVSVPQDVVQYLVKWKGYDEVEASWKSVVELEHSRELIAEYEAVRRQEELQEEGDDGSVELAVAWVMAAKTAEDGGGSGPRAAFRCSYSAPSSPVIEADDCGLRGRL